jgi:hypothetical protein
MARRQHFCLQITVHWKQSLLENHLNKLQQNFRKVVWLGLPLPTKHGMKSALLSPMLLHALDITAD